MIKKLLLILLLCSTSFGAWGTLEDFTTYTEVDTQGYLTVAANTITWTNFDSRVDTAYVYKDKGAAHFSGDFTHRFKWNVTACDADNIAHPYMLANSVGDRHDIQVGSSEDAVFITWYNNSGTHTIYLQVSENGSATSDNYAGASLSTDYYLTLDRDDDGGANNTGQYTLYICTTNYHGEAGSVAVDTLQVDSSAGEQNDFRYVYGTSSYDDGSAIQRLISGTVKDLDLNEATAGGASQVIIIPN
ncbi:MAG: hypothetical protein GWN77_03270 [Gammaproteobacteria bacterium]|nr:hypothetical protein [Gammaproteobacteria bacterium]NIX01385.1 hypothetical protein [Phycisphaerae bacterium]